MCKKEVDAMEQRYEAIREDGQACLAEARQLLEKPNPTVQEQNFAIQCLTRAVKLEVPEAMVLMARLMQDGKLKPLQGSVEETVQRLMEKAAKLEDPAAAAFMADPPLLAKAACIYDAQVIRALIHVSMYRRQQPKKRLLANGVLLGLLLLLFLCLLFLDGPSQMVILGLVWTVFLTGLLCYMHFLMPTLSYRGQKALQNASLHYQFFPEQLRVVANSQDVQSTSYVSYQSLYKIMETDRYLFLWQTGRQAMIVDKATFEGGMPEKLRQILEASLGKKYIRCKY